MKSIWSSYIVQCFRQITMKHIFGYSSLCFFLNIIIIYYHSWICSNRFCFAFSGIKIAVTRNASVAYCFTLLGAWCALITSVLLSHFKISNVVGMGLLSGLIFRLKQSISDYNNCCDRHESWIEATAWLEAGWSLVKYLLQFLMAVCYFFIIRADWSSPNHLTFYCVNHYSHHMAFV